MKKKVLLSALSAAILLLSACGSSDSGSGSTPTTVTVERGPVFNATVEDANGQRAVNTPNTNRYTFSATPVYPITVWGGQVDVNYDGIIDTNDIPLPITLQTDRGETITSMTTFLTALPADKKENLATTVGVSMDELYALPSEAKGKVVAANNAAFSALYSASHDATVNLEEDFLNTFEVLKQEEVATEESSDNITEDELAEMEEQVNATLGISHLTEADLAEINHSSDDYDNVSDDVDDIPNDYDNVSDDISNDYDNITDFDNVTGIID